MKSMVALPLLFVPLLWVPCGLTGALTGVCTEVAAASALAVAPVTDPVDVDGDDVQEVSLPSGFSVEYPREPMLLGATFDLVVRGPDLQSLHLGVEDHLGDIIIGRVTRREVASGSGEPGAGLGDGSDAKTIELSRPVSIAREGDYSLPLAVVDALGGTTDLPSVELVVLLDVPDGHRNQVSDLLAPVTVPVPPASPWPFIGGALLGLVLLGWLVIREGREKPVFVYHPPADRVAMESLEDLRQRLPQTREEIRPFLIRLSDVLRVYIEDVFQLHAPALTTEEFLEQATHRHDALSERRDTLAEFLERCDLVKYAGDRPAPAAAEPLLATVERFIEETRSLVGEPPVADDVTGVLSPADRLRVEAQTPTAGSALEQQPASGHADGGPA